MELQKSVALYSEFAVLYFIMVLASLARFMNSNLAGAGMNIIQHQSWNESNRSLSIVKNRH